MNNSHFTFIMANDPDFSRRRFRDYAECLTLSDIKRHNARAGGGYWDRGKAAWHGTSESPRVHVGPHGVFLVQKHTKVFDKEIVPYWQLIRVNYTAEEGRRPVVVRPVDVNTKYDTPRAAHAAAAILAGQWTPEQLAEMGVTE